MSAIGSRNNPYSYSEYVMNSGNGTWSCGWVQDNGVLVYISHQNLRYTGKGEYSNPFPQEVYTEMANHEFWIGGWVQYSSGKNYCDKNNTFYNNNYGSSSTPWPLSVYNEMCEHNIWEGGWIMYSDGAKHYIQNFNLTEESGGCGCGCGSSGCGCGCSDSSGDGSAEGCGSSGCGSSEDDGSGSSSGSNSDPIDGRVRAGSGVIGTFFNGGAKLSVSWTDGNTFASTSRSVMTFELQVTERGYSDVYYTIYGEWSRPYEARIAGSIEYKKNGISHMACFSDGVFVVPNEYRIDHDDVRYGF